MTDPIADMLTRIRNALAVRKTELTVPYSRAKFAIAEILAREGYIGGVEKVRMKTGVFDEIRITLSSHEHRVRTLHSLRRISTPGRRLYVGYRDLPGRTGAQGMMIVSTPKGLMTSNEARRQKLGGEIICEVS